MTEFNLIYVTFPNKKLALKVVTHCVKSKLVACANVIDGTTSVYEWKGKLCKESECIAIMKAKSKLVKKIVSEIKKLHSYECPCILSLPIIGGSEQFLKWLRSSE